MTLFGKGKDWILAPIAGTAILVCYAGVIFNAWKGDTHGMLLLGIMAEVIGMRRDKYLEGTTLKRHPGCVAPSCLRGGKCTGPCKIDR